MQKRLLKKILIKIDKVLFNGNLKNLYASYINKTERMKERKMERKSASYKSDFFNYGFSISYAKNEDAQINKFCDVHGTDKGETTKDNHPYDWISHNYSDLYEMLFRCRRKDIRLLIECGIGTNNINVQSNMTINGKPGASLRMWRDYFPSAKVIGVDIDKKIFY